MAVELAAAYISIIPSTGKIKPEVAKALGAVEKDSAKTGATMGSNLSQAMGAKLKKTALGVGVSAGGVLAAGLTKGLSRLNAIEQAEAKLTGLGNSAADVSKIMENANAAVKGTAYGLDEAATTAAMAVAAGIKPGQELEQVLKTTADTAGIAGASMSEMGQIFGSVAARGKLQGDDLMQLQSRGIPVLQMLAKELGVTAAEVSDLVSKGKIDFETFERALRAGVGGAALEAGNTVKGAFSNMYAALGRLGATAAGPFFKQTAGAFTGVTNALDKMNGAAKPVFAQIGTWIEGSAVPAFQKFAASATEAFQVLSHSGGVQVALKNTSDAFQQIFAAGKALAPAISSIAQSLGKASAAVGVSTWQIFAMTLEGVGSVAESLAGPLNTIAGFMQEHPRLVTAAVGAWAGFKGISAIVTKFSAGTALARKGVEALRQSYESTNPVLAGMGKGYFKATWALSGLAKEQKKAGDTFKSTTTQMHAVVKGLAGAGLGGLKAAIGNVVSAFGGPWGIAITGATAAVTAAIAEWKKMDSFQSSLAKSTQISTQAYREFFSAMAGGSATFDVAEQKITEQIQAMKELGENGPAWYTKASISLREFSAEHETLGRAMNILNPAVFGLSAAFGGLTEEQTKQKAQWRDNAEAAKLASKAFESTGLSMEQLASV